MRSVRLFIDLRSGKRFWARTVKELRAQIGGGGSKVSRMYVDTAEGTYHIGYVVGPYWLEMYDILPVQGPVRREVKV